MSKKIALITGISGQDGAYLGQFLLNKNYKVIGSDRRSARSVNWRLRRLGIENKIFYEEMELGEIYEIQRVFKKYKFDEVYHLAAQSFVKASFNSPLNTSNITGLGTLRILETIRSTNPKIKFYQASSSEMYGDILEKKQNEKTPFNPQSPYAISKLYAHYMTSNYRKSYNLFAVSGILFNHESPLRGETFVTRKITIGLSRIKLGLQKELVLGNLNAKRDWGHAEDYAEAMWKMMQLKKPEDFVIATGKQYSVRDFVNNSAKNLGMKIKWVGKGINEKGIDKKTGKTIVKVGKRYFRPTEVDTLLGDARKAKKVLKWKPKITFNQMVKEMVESDFKEQKKLIS